jgi:hypothetical protein
MEHASDNHHSRPSIECLFDSVGEEGVSLNTWRVSGEVRPSALNRIGSGVSEDDPQLVAGCLAVQFSYVRKKLSIDGRIPHPALLSRGCPNALKLGIGHRIASYVSVNDRLLGSCPKLDHDDVDQWFYLRISEKTAEERVLD